MVAELGRGVSLTAHLCEQPRKEQNKKSTNGEIKLRFVIERHSHPNPCALATSTAAGTGSSGNWLRGTGGSNHSVIPGPFF